MGKFLKVGKVVVLLAGRFAGKKAVIVRAYDDGTKERPFPHVLVAGIKEAPLRVTKAMSKKKILKRSRVVPFIKYVSHVHLMPTRYSVDVDVKSVVGASVMKKPESRVTARKDAKKMFEHRYIHRGKNSSGVQFLYSKLRF